MHCICIHLIINHVVGINLQALSPVSGLGFKIRSRIYLQCLPAYVQWGRGQQWGENGGKWEKKGEREVSLQLSANGLPAFPRVAWLEVLPAVNGTGLDANHVLVAILWPKVGHRLGLVNPWVPDNDIAHGLAINGEDRLLVCAGDDHDGTAKVERLVDTVRLPVNGNLSVVFSLHSGICNLVNVGGSLEIAHTDIGNILKRNRV